MLESLYIHIYIYIYIYTRIYAYTHIRCFCSIAPSSIFQPIVAIFRITVLVVIPRGELSVHSRLRKGDRAVEALAQRILSAKLATKVEATCVAHYLFELTLVARAGCHSRWQTVLPTRTAFLDDDT